MHRFSWPSAQQSPKIRRARHAGSWYEDNGDVLREEIQRLLGEQYAHGATRDPSLKALIVPHAGLRYSGEVAARAYACVDVQSVRKVFIIGPSHHANVRGIGIPAEGVTEYATPMGNLPLDDTILEELRSTGQFDTLAMHVDEAEHSLEMQLPFLAELLLHSPLRSNLPPATVIPLMVGQTSPQDEAKYGGILAPHFDETGNLLVISSDFCHWGAQFGYKKIGRSELAITYRDGPYPENAGIEGLDREAMTLIANQDSSGFRAYLERCGNTICGRHPILVLLETLCVSQRESLKVVFLKYAQSSAFQDMAPPTHASVSYACACVGPLRIPRPVLGLPARPGLQMGTGAKTPSPLQPSE